MIKKIKNLNFPLMLGSIIVIFLVSMAFYPEWFTSKDPTFEEEPKYVEMKVDGVVVEKFLTSPMPPNEENIFGTDDAGRDVYARLVYGTRNTLRLAFLVAVFRLILALPIGIAAGMGLKFFSWLIKIFNTIFTAIPMVVLSFVILNIGYFKNLSIDKSIMVFVIVLTIVGWAKLGGVIEDSARLVMEEDFIEGEVAIGKSKFQIAYQNLLPHIIPSSISLFFKEMAMALFLLAQLSVLGVFVGVVRRVEDYAFKAAYVMNLEPEWGGSLSRISRNVKAYDNVYWMVIYPILFFGVAIIGINLTGEGLKIEFQKRNSRVISSIKKIAYIFSPIIFISQLKNIKTYYKPVIIKVISVAVIIIISVVPLKPSKYKFNLDIAKDHLRELTSEKYEGRVAGSKGGYLAGEYIINTLKSYGYEIDSFEVPLMYDEYYEDENGEIQHALGNNFLAPNVIKSGEIKIKDGDGEEKIYNLHEDFTMAGISTWGFEPNKDGRIEFKGIASDLENLEKVPKGKEVFLIGEGYYDMNTFYRTSMEESFAGKEVTLSSGEKVKINYNTVTFSSGKEVEFKGKVLLQEGYDITSNAYEFYYPLIVPFEELRKALKDGYKEVEIIFDVPQKLQQGRIITAFLPGKGKDIDNPGELVIVGAPYDGVYDSNIEQPFAMSAAPVAIALETARNLALARDSYDKSIQFIFWDNEIQYIENSNINSSYLYCRENNKSVEMSNKHGYYYFDITYPGYKKDEKLNILSSPGPRQGSGNYITTLEMQKRLKELNVKFSRLNKGDPASSAFNSLEMNSRLSISLGNYTTELINSNSGVDTLENINYKILEDMGRIIIDTMTMNPYMMEENKE